MFYFPAPSMALNYTWHCACKRQTLYKDDNPVMTKEKDKTTVLGDYQILKSLLQRCCCQHCCSEAIRLNKVASTCTAAPTTTTLIKKLKVKAKSRVICHNEQERIRSPPIGCARQNTVPLKFDSKPLVFL